MKEIKSSKKTSILKKILIKVSRILGYELIDQSTLEFPVSNKNSIEQISVPGKKSITIGLGETIIKRQVKEIDIIIKTCTSVQLVSQNKKRIFEKEKYDYTFRSIKSLFRSALILKEKIPGISIKFTIIDIGSSEENKEKMKSIISGFDLKLVSLDKGKFEFDFKTINKNNSEIEKNMQTTMSSIYESFCIAKNCKDLIYFVEDDYIHKSDSLVEMVLAYEKFSTIFEKELFLLSTDYPYLYKKLDNSKVLIGAKYHWRTVQESLLTFLTSNIIIKKYYNDLLEMAKNEQDPFEKNLHEIYEKEICLSPIPSLSVHCANINSVYGISPNINLRKLWDENET